MREIILIFMVVIGIFIGIISGEFWLGILIAIIAIANYTKGTKTGGVQMDMNKKVDDETIEEAFRETFRDQEKKTKEVKKEEKSLEERNILLKERNRLLRISNIVAIAFFLLMFLIAIWYYFEMGRLTALSEVCNIAEICKSSYCITGIHI